MSEWQLTRLEDVTEKIGMGPFGSNIKVSTFVETGIPIISGFHLHGVRLLDENYRFITEDHANKLHNSNVFRGDVIFTHAGTLGQVAIIPENSQYKRYVLSQRQFYLRPDCNALNGEFITYYFHSKLGQYELLSNASQTGVPSIARPSSHLKSIEISLPPLREQEAIAEVLSSLDDKIDLLKRQNKTLEGMAEALFRQWFIEEAQDDWEEFTVNDIAENIRSVIKPGDIDRKVRLVGLEHFDSKSLVLSRYEDTDVLGSQKFIFEQGQILFGKLRPYFHNIAIPFFDGACSTDVLVIQAKEPEWRFFLFFFLNQEWVVEVATQSAEGTRMPRTNWNFLASLPVQLPDPKLLSEFNGLIEPVVAKLSKNWTEVNLLQDQRNTLLPRLMSGEVRVNLD
jgi:type I restriction enzyme S subunit